MKKDFKYKQIYMGLREKIRSGEYSPGYRLPSQRRLIADYGVSLATITSALHSLVREGLIVTHPGQGTFVADRNVSDKSANRRSSRITLGLFIPGISSHPSGMLKGVYEEANETDAKLEFIIFHGEAERRQRCKEVLDGKIKVDGCLILRLPGYDDVVNALRERDFPYIIIESPCVHEGMNQILMDHRKGAEIAVGHLIKHGHERIAYLGPVRTNEEGGPNYWVQAKFEGYCNTLKNAGLTLDPALVVETPSDSYEDACRGTKTLLERAEFSALFANIDIFSLAAIDVLRAEGKRIPQDVAITSFSADENTDMASEKYNVSGMCAPRIDIGRAAVRALTHIIDRSVPRDIPYVEELPMTFLRRTSCGCA